MDDGAEQKKPRTRAPVYNVIRFVFVCAFSAALAIILFGSRVSRIGFLDVRLALKPVLSTHGETQFVFNPLGSVSWRTHKFPSKLTISVERIHEDQLLNLAKGKITYKQLLDTSMSRNGHFFRGFVFWLIKISVIGGIAGALLSRRSLLSGGGGFLVRLARGALLRTALPGSAIGLCVVVPLIFFTFIQFDPAAFREPSYQGMLGKAPELLTYIEQGRDSASALNDRMFTISNNLSRFYLQMKDIEKTRIVGGTKFYILHVSDIHSNPLAAEMIRTIVENLHPDIIINTGDITDHGSPEELALLKPLADISLPQFFISGNHDSVEITRALREQFGMKVLEGDVATIKGVRILGFGDPKAKEHFPKDAVVDTKGLNELAKTVSERLDEMEEKPQILLIHDPDVARKFLGAVPLILTGHSHNALIEPEKDKKTDAKKKRGKTDAAAAADSSHMKRPWLVSNGSVLVNAGTSGASGVRYFKNYETPFYSAALITAVVGDEFTVSRITMFYLDNMENDYGFYTYTKDFE